MWHGVFIVPLPLVEYSLFTPPPKNYRFINENVLNENVSAGGKSENIMNGLGSIKLEYTLLGDAANCKSRVNLSVDTEGALSYDPHDAQHVTWADHTAASRMHNMNSPLFDF